ncbi:hypothetical protein GRAN_1356 [Granulicella sibirica]|uniref:Uncharacterized protein n=1 Tax=Granulicella sibirica TaxID=2479048 RepID=A0A4Q0T8J6_9BACT|nr:hypothetical protein GRAN_1356 [Granulicella sibirica]
MRVPIQRILTITPVMEGIVCGDRRIALKLVLPPRQNSNSLKTVERIHSPFISSG